MWDLNNSDDFVDSAANILVGTGFLLLAQVGQSLIKSAHYDLGLDADTDYLPGDITSIL